MSRRTRKQKERAKHQFLISWRPEINDSSEAKLASKRNFVKSQTSPNDKVENLKDSINENNNNSAKINDLASIKGNILKSLILAGFILASEIVLYFIWN